MVFGSYFIPSDDKIVFSHMQEEYKDKKDTAILTNILEENTLDTSRKLLRSYEGRQFDEFNIKDSWIYAMTFEKREKTKFDANPSLVYKVFRIDKDKEEVIAEIEKEDRLDIGFNLAGDWILANIYGSGELYAISLDGKEKKELLEGYADGDFLDFSNVKGLEEKYS